MTKAKGGIAAAVTAIARPVAEGLGYRLWDVRWEKEGADRFLRVFIDRDGSMSTEDCEKVSRALDPLIDEAAVTEDHYYFEVCSPGLGRRLTKPAHYAAMAGQKARIRLFRPGADGLREHEGILKDADGDGVTLQTDAGDLRFAYADITLAKLCDDEDLF